MKKQKLFVRIVCIALVVLMAVSVGAVAITAFSANAAQSTEEVSASVSAGASGYINASYVNLVFDIFVFVYAFYNISVCTV